MKLSRSRKPNGIKGAIAKLKRMPKIGRFKTMLPYDLEAHLETMDAFPGQNQLKLAFNSSVLASPTVSNHHRPSQESIYDGFKFASNTLAKKILEKTEKNLATNKNIEKLASKIFNATSQAFKETIDPNSNATVKQITYRTKRSYAQSSFASRIAIPNQEIETFLKSSNIQFKL